MTNKKVEKSQQIFGRIEKVVIFALPNKKGVKKSVLKVVKWVRRDGLKVHNLITCKVF